MAVFFVVVLGLAIRRKMGLGEDEVTNKSRIVILKLDEIGYVGVLVDEVKEVIALGESEINRNVKSKRQDTVFINGIGKHGDDLISIFDLSAVVDDPKA